MQMPVETSEVTALIRLLDDPDTTIYQQVSDRLVSFGQKAVPFLEFELQLSYNTEIRSRIRSVIRQIEFRLCGEKVCEWLRKPDDLLSGVLLLSSYRYPATDTDVLRTMVEHWVKDVWIELSANLTALENVSIINHILFDVHGLRPETRYGGNPESWFIRDVLHTQGASPTLLTVLYRVIAERLHLPIVAIDLPHHPILAYTDLHSPTPNDHLFYLDPFNKGAVFGPSELERQLMQSGYNVKELLTPMSHVHLLKRMLVELKTVYTKRQDHIRASEVRQLLQLFR